MNNIFILALEPIESRYTCEWFEFLPQKISKFVFQNDIDCSVWNVAGKQSNAKATEGAFLNFVDTNIWKNTQINQIAEYFQQGIIKSGDKFLFTDAWHPGIIQLRYMASLTGIEIEIHSIWHAGSYDPNDFLGRKFDKSWSFNFERSLFSASNKNYFATVYHSELFRRTLENFKSDEFLDKYAVCGLPFDYLKDIITPGKVKKEDIILFPHRISTEKQPEIFKDLAKELPEYRFIICQEENLFKLEYHKLLRKSKIVFSANLQETLGISCYEGFLAGSFPLVPDRLSYIEMYPEECKYPSTWTSSWENYLEHRQELKALIRRIMSNHDQLMDSIQSKVEFYQFFSMDKMLKTIFNQKN